MRRRSRWQLWTTGVCVGLLAASGCGEPPVAPGDLLELRAESRHFLYYGVPSDELVDAEYQERHLAWASRLLELEPVSKIAYHKYRDRAHLQEVTGHTSGTGFAETDQYRFHSIHGRDNHEYIHVLFNAAVGTAPPFFNEGVAVAHHGASFSGPLDGSPLWNGKSVHAIALDHLRAGTLPPPSSLLAASGFYDVDGQVTYPLAGSFVRFLIDREGIAKFKEFVGRTDGPGASAGETRQDFLATFGQEFEAVWGEWLVYLEGISGE